jgi:TrpR-related protein YerC/YecD
MKMDEKLEYLFKAIVNIKDIKDIKECGRFIKDLFTPQEIGDIANRWWAVRLLKSGVTQREIASELGVSVTTVSSANRTLRYGSSGYELIYNRLSADYSFQKNLRKSKFDV